MGQSQTVDGLTLTLNRIGIAIPPELFTGQELASFENTYPRTQAVVVVELEALNTTTTTASLPVYTSTKALVNDEQIDMDFLLSEVETEVLAGAKIDMRAIFLTTRYAPADIRSVRFVLEKTISLTVPTAQTTYDFVVEVP